MARFIASSDLFKTLTGLGGVTSINQLATNPPEPSKGFNPWEAFVINEIFILILDNLLSFLYFKISQVNKVREKWRFQENFYWETVQKN